MNQQMSITKWIIWGALIGLFSNLMLYGIPPPKAIPIIVGAAAVGATLGGIAASLINYIWRWRQHSDRWQTTKKRTKKHWQPLLVLSTVVWAVVIFVPVSYEMDLDEPEAFLITLGPFVIAMAICFLFPPREL